MLPPCGNPSKLKYWISQAILNGYLHNFQEFVFYLGCGKFFVKRIRPVRGASPCIIPRPPVDLVSFSSTFTVFTEWRVTDRIIVLQKLIFEPQIFFSDPHQKFI